MHFHSPSVSNPELALAALLLEAALSYPAFLYRVIGHPVTWMGWLLGRLEQRLNRSSEPANKRKGLGALCLAMVLASSAIGAALVDRAIPLGFVGMALRIFAASSLLAQRSLYNHVKAVADALDRRDLAAARTSVAMIVGRDPDRLDESGVARAAIESLAENFSDAVVAPLFWMAVAGLPGAAMYKAANTADSMIGHKTEQFRSFGWAAARLDDLLNLPASRLAALWIALGAAVCGGSATAAIRICLRDARLHRSPNAGWPEAAMAGALGVRLAGPRIYGNQRVDDAFMGHPGREANAAEIYRSLRIFRSACMIQCALLLALCLILRW